jgi:hypothetical protein
MIKLAKKDGEETIRDVTECFNALSCLISPERIYLIDVGKFNAILVDIYNQIVLETDKTRIKKVTIAQTATNKKSVKDVFLQTKEIIRYEPYNLIHNRNLQENFLFMATDTFWDYMSNENVIEYINEGLVANKDLQQICKDLIEQVKAKRTLLPINNDFNLSLVLYKFPTNKLTLKRQNAMIKLKKFKKNSNEFSSYANFQKLKNLQNKLAQLEILNSKIDEFIKTEKKKETTCLDNDLTQYELELKKLGDENVALNKQIEKTQAHKTKRLNRKQEYININFYYFFVIFRIINFYFI